MERLIAWGAQGTGRGLSLQALGRGMQCLHDTGYWHAGQFCPMSRQLVGSCFHYKLGLWAFAATHTDNRGRVHGKEGMHMGREASQNEGAGISAAILDSSSSTHNAQAGSIPWCSRHAAVKNAQQ
jgi:hypothetical protein